MLSQRRRTFRTLLIGVNILFVFILLLQLFFYLVLPEAAIRNIIISGNVQISRKALYQLLNIKPWSSPSFYQIKTELLRTKLKQYALIKDASVKKKYPDTLEISLLQRSPLAVVLLNSQENEVPALLDGEGVLYSIGQLPSINLPVLSGLNLQLSNRQQRLPKLLLPLLSNLEQLKSKSPAYFSIISEIDIKFTDDGLITDLSLTSYPTRIRSDENVDKDMIKTALVTLEVLQRGDIVTPIIDMRTTGIVYAGRGGT